MLRSTELRPSIVEDCIESLVSVDDDDQRPPILEPDRKRSWV